MSELKTVDQIDTNYSKSQLYWRINKLVDSGLIDPPERGERNEYLLNSEQTRILQKLYELEEEHDTVKEAIGKLEKERIEPEVEGDIRERVEQLEHRTAALEEKVETLENLLSAQNDRLQEFRERWKNQLREGAKKVKDLFG
ncbi:hypothetical protein KGY79_06930 [Candidatus Bipolaricaulota bacterium]|nr:hypothetical protein [Candidatus Bipolaricaulota bacterium]